MVFIEAVIKNAKTHIFTNIIFCFNKNNVSDKFCVLQTNDSLKKPCSIPK